MLMRKGWEAQYWSPIIEAEQLHVSQYAGLFDVTAAKKRIEISGAGALDFLQDLTTSDVDIPIGQVTNTFMLNEIAGIKDEIKIIRLKENKFFILCSGPVEASWIEKHIPFSSSISINDHTAGICGLRLIGPKANEIMNSLDKMNFDLANWQWKNVKEIYVGNVPVTVVYDIYDGIEGWELYTTFDQGIQLWDLLMNAGNPYHIIAGGARALESLRIDSLSVRSGKDFWSEHDPYEVGLDHMVDLTKPSFIGKEALVNRKEQGPKVALVKLTIKDPSVVVMGYEPILSGDKVVGFITSAGYGYSTGRGIVYALLKPEALHQNSEFSIEYFDKRYEAVVISKSLVSSK
jgi:glycine cleavage system aminomethyltransferase T